MQSLNSSLKSSLAAIIAKEAMQAIEEAGSLGDYQLFELVK